MTPFNDLDHCMCCTEPIDYREYTYTMDSFGIAMCQPCTRNYISKLPYSEPLERILYAALLNKGVKGMELQYFDGFKTVDIAIMSAKLHIEVDGPRHSEATQARSDMWRTYYSLRQSDVMTLRIPNTVVLEDVESAATLITKVVSLRLSA
jgi:very-short-patch-repair endonuclease